MQDLTTGSLTRHLLKTTSFMLVSMVFQTLYVLIDLYWVGRLGTQAVAAVAISGNLMFIVLALSQMLGVGTTTLVSHAAGRKERERALLVFNQSQLLSILVGAIFLAVGMALRVPYARSLSADAATSDLANDYLLWFIPALALQFGLVAMGAALRGTGNFKPGMIVQTATVIINIILAPVLIFGWGTGRPLGVAGAALATFIAIVVGIVWMAAYFIGPSAYLTFIRADMRPRVRLWMEMLKIGLPAGAEFALMTVYMVMVYAVSRPFGAAAQAGFGIGMRIIQACFLPVVALAFAAAPVAGQNFGARKAERVRQTFTVAVAMASGAMLILAIATQFVAPAAVGLFSDDPNALAVGVEYLRIIAWNFVPSGIVFVSSSMFQAMGNTMPSLITSMTRIVLVSVPVLLLAPLPGFELRWVWYLSVGSVFMQLLMNLALLRREFRRRLAPEPQAAATEPPGLLSGNVDTQKIFE
jgi:putative MATE family efflux protein